MRTPAAFAFARPADEPPSTTATTVAIPTRRRASQPLGEILAGVASAARDAISPRRLSLDEVARWCAEVGGVDPRLEQAALRHALSLVDSDVLVADVVGSLRARLVAAGELLPSLVARGGVTRMLAGLGLDDVDPPDGGLTRPLPPRIARFYWQRLRAFVAWSAACQA